VRSGSLKIETPLYFFVLFVCEVERVECLVEMASPNSRNQLHGLIWGC
jgi:hypothetical protein